MYTDGVPNTYQFDLPDTGRPSWFALPEPYYPNAQWYSENRATARDYHPINGIRAVVIHATAGWATEHVVSHWLTASASAHWIVPDEDEAAHGHNVWAIVDEALAAWHVKNSRSHPDAWDNRNRVNHWSVGIEIVNTQDVQNYADPYSDWQLRITALIVRRCWAKYPNLKHIISHAKLDPSNRADPGRQFPWGRFRDYVLDATHDLGLEPESLTVSPPSATSPIPPGDSCCS